MNACAVLRGTLCLLINASALLSQTKIELLDTITKLGMKYQAGEIPVYFTPSGEQRALRCRDTLLEAKKWFEQQTGVRQHITVLLARREEWGKLHAEARYPVPHVVMPQMFPPVTVRGEPNVMYLPARFEDF